MTWVIHCYAVLAIVSNSANYRLQQEQESLGAAQGFLYSDSQLALLQHPLFDGEKEILLELIDRCKMECDSKRQRLIDVLEKLLDSNVRELPYIVVFCDQPWVADQVFTDLMIPFIGKIQHVPVRNRTGGNRTGGKRFGGK